MTGGELQAAVIELAAWTGWRVAHFRSVKVQRADGSTHYATPVGADGKGFPDLVLIHPRRRLHLYREIKGQNEAVRPDQAVWLDALEKSGADVAVWRPSDWPDIEQLLNSPTRGGRHVPIRR